MDDETDITDVSLKHDAAINFGPLLRAINNMSKHYLLNKLHGASGWDFNEVDIARRQVKGFAWLDYGDNTTKIWKFTIMENVIFAEDDLFMFLHARHVMMWQDTEQHEIALVLPGYFYYMTTL